ncbi:MAG: hypothetical protein ACYDCL_18410 [Myxococcales bacterium]
MSDRLPSVVRLSTRVPAPAGGLKSDTDYLYCPVCKAHVACRRIPSGGWQVQCPGCAGECSGCLCHLVKFCFGSRDQFPPFEGGGESR